MTSMTQVLHIILIVLVAVVLVVGFKGYFSIMLALTKLLGKAVQPPTDFSGLLRHIPIRHVFILSIFHSF